MTVDWGVFTPVLVILAILIIREELSMTVLTNLYSKVEMNFGWYFILAPCIFVALGVYLIFSKYGNVALGSPDDKPSMPMFIYVATIISTGSGQWAKWITTTPINIEPFSIEAIRNANVYGITFWGFQYMAICAIVISTTAYMLYVRNRPRIRLSEIYRGILGDKFTDGIWGDRYYLCYIFDSRKCGSIRLRISYNNNNSKTF